MNTSIKAGLAVAIALRLLCAPALSAAAPSSSVASAAPGMEAEGLLPARSFLEAVNQSQHPSSLKPLSAGASTKATFDTALRSSALGELQGRADLLLWNLCAVVRSQDSRHHFEAIDRGADTVHLSEEIEKISAVPLPGAVWLFVIGVMGLAGARVTGITRGKASEGQRSTSPSMGSTYAV